MGVQACRLPALKRLKPLKTLKRLKTLTTRYGGPTLPFAMLHPASNRHPKATHPWHASPCSQQAPQGHTSMASYGRQSLPFASP